MLQILLSGNNVPDGFGLAFRILQEYKLDNNIVYCATARYLASKRRINGIKQLLGMFYFYLD